MVRDPCAIDGKIHPPETRFDGVVVGAGTAGTAAAIEAAAGGASVLLIDENPLPGPLIGTDVPLFFGGRATAAVQRQAHMVEQLFRTNPQLEQAFEAGVDVRLGTMAWGLYQNGPAMRALPGPMLGIADDKAAQMVGFGRLILATGARDVVLGFPGWNQPGVMGAQAFALLVDRYDAFAGRRIAVLGATDTGFATACRALDRGIEVAAIVDVVADAHAPAALPPRLADAAVPLLRGHALRRAEGGPDGVERIVLEAPDGRDMILDCDTVVLAIGVHPATELLDAAGLSPGGSVSLIGDCAQARPPQPAELQAWAQALSRHATDGMIVCQCEDVSLGDLIGVQPPHYLPRPPKMAARSLSTLERDGPSHPDQIKRLTRAGMGPCQGRRCRDQVRCILAMADGVPLDRVPVASFRAPVRPVPLSVLADWAEAPDMAAGWDVWFGIPTQWTPYAVIGTAEEADCVSGHGGNMHV